MGIMDNSRRTSGVRALSGIMPPITRSSDGTGHPNKRAKHWMQGWRMEGEKAEIAMHVCWSQSCYMLIC